MDEALQSRVEVLAHEFAGQARTIEDVNELMRLMMKSALERMLNTEMDVHLGRRSPGGSARLRPNSEKLHDLIPVTLKPTTCLGSS